MPIVDLKCRESFASSTLDCPKSRQESLFLGHCGQIYLFFHLPVNLGACFLQKARLILFKLPYLSPCEAAENTCAGRAANQYALYPLLDFFSAFSGIFSSPAVDPGRRVCFTDLCSCSYTEIDLTEIVADWMQGKLENRGILLTGSPDSPCLYYASGQYRIPWMRPKLRLTYQTIQITRALRSVPCEVTVKRA